MWCVNLKLRTSGHTANTTPKRSACRDRNLSNLGFKFGELATKFGSGTETRKLSAREDQCPHHPYHTVLAAGFPSKTLTRFGMIWGYMDTVCPKMPKNTKLQDCPWSVSASDFVPGLLGEGLRPVDRGTGPARSPKMGDTQWYRTQTNGFVSVSIPSSLINVCGGFWSFPIP